MKKSLTVAEAGRLGGLRGGRSTSAAKVAAARRNMAKARKAHRRMRELFAKALDKP